MRTPAAFVLVVGSIHDADPVTGDSSQVERG